MLQRRADRFKLSDDLRCHQITQGGRNARADHDSGDRVLSGEDQQHCAQPSPPFSGRADGGREDDVLIVCDIHAAFSRGDFTGSFTLYRRH